MGKANLKDISLALAKKKGLEPSEADRYLDAFFSVIKEGLSADKAVKIKGLGTFKLVEVRDRESVDVNTGERVVIDGHAKVAFTPENSLKELVNKPFSQFETVELNDGVEFDKELNETDAIVSDTVLSEHPLDANADKPEPSDKQGGSISDILPETNEAETQSANIVASAKDELGDDKKLPDIDFEAEDLPQIAFNNENNSEQCAINENPKANTDFPASDNINSQETATLSGEKSQCVLNPTKPVSASELPAVDNSDNAFSGTEYVDNEPNNDNIAPPAHPENSAGNIETDATVCRKHHVLKTIIYAIILLALVVGMFFAGFYFGERKDVKAIQEKRHALPVRQTGKNRVTTQSKPSAETSASVDTASAKNAEATLKLASEKDTEVEEKHAADGKSEKETTSQSIHSAERIVETGAYNIIGTEKTVTVKSGQTMKDLARRYLGEGMECYIQVYNKKNEAREGETINIPKLQLKKKGNYSAVAIHL